MKVDPPEVMSDVKEPTWKEVNGFSQKRKIKLRSRTKCSTLQSFVEVSNVTLKIMATFPSDLLEGKIPACWKEANGCFVPKKKSFKPRTQFRTISLLNVGGNVAVKSKRKTIPF